MFSIIAWSGADALKFIIPPYAPFLLGGYLWDFSETIIQSISFFGVMGLSVLTYILIFVTILLFKKSIIFIQIYNYLFYFICWCITYNLWEFKITYVI